LQARTERARQKAKRAGKATSLIFNAVQQENSLGFGSSGNHPVLFGGNVNRTAELKEVFSATAASSRKVR